MAVSSFTSYEAGASLRNAVLRNRAFWRRVAPGWRHRPGARHLREAWKFLSPMQQATMVLRFAKGGAEPYRSVAGHLGVSVSTVYWHEEQAAATLIYFLGKPCAWAMLPPRTRNVLLAHGIRQPGDLTRRFVQDLLSGEAGPWGPRSSEHLNACLDSLGELRLHERLPPGYPDYAPAAERRRLGPPYPPVLLNPVFVAMVRNGRRHRPTLAQLMVAWRALDDDQRQAMALLYRHGRGPGDLTRMEVAADLLISRRALRARETAAVAVLQSAVAS